MDSLVGYFRVVDPVLCVVLQKLLEKRNQEGILHNFLDSNIVEVIRGFNFSQVLHRLPPIRVVFPAMTIHEVRKSLDEVLGDVFGISFSISYAKFGFFLLKEAYLLGFFSLSLDLFGATRIAALVGGDKRSNLSDNIVISNIRESKAVDIFHNESSVIELYFQEMFNNIVLFLLGLHTN